MQNEFLSLPAEKQNRIVSAALEVFGRNGYKKASCGDIAAAAGVSKGMVFYYFGSKKQLYLYLIEFCTNVMINEIEKGLDKSVGDFFDRLKMTAKIKISVIKNYPAIISFFMKMYYETDEDVKEEVCKYTSDDELNRLWFEILGTNISGLKNESDARLLTKLLVWASIGFAGELPPDAAPETIDALAEEYFECIDVLKKYFCKQELPKTR